MRAISGRRSRAAGNGGREPGYIEAVQHATSRSPDIGDTAPLRRFVVIVGEPVDGGSALRIEEPDRLPRIWSLLQATSEQLDSATLLPEGIPRLQGQLRAIRREFERALPSPLAAELGRVLPSHDEAPSAGALRIECAVLLSWTGSLVVQMLAAFAASHERLRYVRTIAASADADAAR
jgi:hypothetical protein